MEMIVKSVPMENILMQVQVRVYHVPVESTLMMMVKQKVIIMVYHRVKHVQLESTAMLVHINVSYVHLGCLMMVLVKKAFQVVRYV